MLLLTATTDVIQVTTSAAVTSVNVHATFMDMSQADPPVVKGTTSGRQNTAITTATTTTVVAAPAASTTRNVKTLHVRNTSATALDVTVIYDQNGTDYELYKANLLGGEQLEWVEGVGFFKIESGFENFSYLRKTAQQSFSATTFADVTGMGFAVAANAKYEFEYEIIFRSATATVGVGLGFNGPASPTSVQGTVIIVGVRGAATAGGVAAGGFVAYDSTAPISAAVEATGTDYVARMAVLLEVGGTAGTGIARWRSETATATTVEAGSFATCKRIG